MIPTVTAKEFLKIHYFKGTNTEDVLLEFAKLHLQEAVECIVENVTMRIEETDSSVRYKSRYSSKDNQTIIVAVDSILNAYPLENIK
jgi:hypothetical protein